MSSIFNNKKIELLAPDLQNDILLMDPFAKIYLALLLASPFISYLILTYLNVAHIMCWV